jgi:hypothetical protein
MPTPRKELNMMATTYSSLGGWASLVSKSLKAGRLAPCLLAVSETRHQVVAIHDLRDSKYPRYNEALLRPESLPVPFFTQQQLSPTKRIHTPFTL